MVFPTVGSWISQIQAQPDDTTITNIKFVTVYVTGSSNVEYAVYDNVNALAYIPFTTAGLGSNTISITGSVATDYKVNFRMIGYPSLGFNPVVKHFSIEQSGLGAIFQTVNLGSNVKLPTTHYAKAFVQPYGSYYWNLSGSVSSDGGTTWTGVPNFGAEFDITSTQGSECLIKFVDYTGSVVLNRVTAYFHTSDVQ